MTAYKARSRGEIPRTGNIKDGGPHRQRDTGDEWLAAGFTWPGPRRSVYMYAWSGDFPCFRVAPGHFEDQEANVFAGLIARCEEADVTIFFDYGTPSAAIKGRLDDEIEDIIKWQAEVAEIGSEINIDDWMIRPQAAGRQSTPAVQGLACRHSIGLVLADEMAQERGR